MSGVLVILLALAMGAVLVVLFVGIGAMARGGEFNRRYGNRLMRMRVVLQGVAILLFVLLILASRQ
jgi:hypothetical protein